jgi:hypothetical protein
MERMTDDNIKQLIAETVFEERWRIACCIESFNIDQNVIGNDNYGYDSVYPIANWDKAIFTLANHIRKLPYVTTIDYLNVTDYCVRCRCKTCNYIFDADAKLKVHFTEELIPVCPKCKKI